MLLISKDGATFEYVSSLGASFDTAFTDGSILGTRNWTDEDVEKPSMIEHYRKCSITAAWDDHQSTIRALELGGKHATRQPGFHVFRDLSMREMSAMTS